MQIFSASNGMPEICEDYYLERNKLVWKTAVDIPLVSREIILEFSFTQDHHEKKLQM